MHDDQKTSDYPPGYTPMTGNDFWRIYMEVRRAVIASEPGVDKYPYETAIERAVLARLPKPDAEPVADQERIYPCADCGKMRSKEEGGTVFTVCDSCWNKHHKTADNAHPPKDTAERDAEIQAKLSERKTVHLWLNDLGVPKHEATGKPMCLLRRLSVALNVQPHDADHVRASPEVEARVDAAVEAGRINDKRDAERDALVRRIDEWLENGWPHEIDEMMREIRDYLVGGGE